MNVRKDMAEKKLEVLTRDSDERVEKVQRQLDEAKMRLRKKEKYANVVLVHSSQVYKWFLLIAKTFG